MIGFYREFIPHFTEVSAILTDLTKGNLPNKVTWLISHQKAFDCLKKSLTCYPILQNPYFSKEFVLQTDACDRGVGAVFLQSDGVDLHPVTFISSKLLHREQRYSIVKEEKDAESNERKLNRELESKEKDRELELKKIQLREKELALKETECVSEVKAKVKLPKFHEGEDIEVFLTSFERLATVHKWDKSQWPVRLIPQLSGKALEAYSRMSVVEIFLKCAVQFNV